MGVIVSNISIIYDSQRSIFSAQRYTTNTYR